MSNKNKTFQTYMLWLIDMACIITSYILAICIKDIGNWGVKIEDRTKHNMICVVFLLVCVVYSFLADWNRDFAIRGYIKEFLSVFRFMTVMIVASFPITFFLKISPIMSRFVVAVFIVIDIILTYIARILFKKTFRKIISNDNNAVRVIVVAESNLMEDTVRKLAENAGNLGYKIVRAYAADDTNRQESSGEPWYIDGVHHAL